MSDSNTENNLKSSGKRKVPKPDYFVAEYIAFLVLWLFGTYCFQKLNFSVFNIEYNDKDILSLLITIYLGLLGVVIVGSAVFNLQFKHYFQVTKQIPLYNKLVEEGNEITRELNDEMKTMTLENMEKINALVHERGVIINKQSDFQDEYFKPYIHSGILSKTWYSIIIVLVIHIVAFTLMYSYSIMTPERYKDIFACLQNGFISYSILGVFIFSYKFMRNLTDTIAFKTKFENQEQDEKKSQK